MTYGNDNYLFSTRVLSFYIDQKFCKPMLPYKCYDLWRRLSVI